MQNRQNELNDLVTSIDRAQNENAQIPDLQAQNNSLQILASLQAQRSETQAQLERIENQLIAQQNANQVASNRLNNIQTENSSLRTQISLQVQRAETQTQTLATLQTQRAEAQAQLQRIDNQLIAQQNATQIASNRLNNIQTENDSLQTQISLQVQRTEAQTQLLTALQAQRADTQTQVEYLENQLATQQNLNIFANAQLNNLQRLQNDLPIELQDRQNLLDILRGVIQNNRTSEQESELLNSSNVMTRTISPEDTARASLLKDSCMALCKENFDSIISVFRNIEDLNIQDKDGKTILMHAAENGFYYGVEKLLERGVDVNIIDHKGANALIYSTMMPHIKWTSIIASGTNDINHKTNKDFNNGNSALHTLVANTYTIWFEDEHLENSAELHIQSNYRGKSFEYVTDRVFASNTVIPSVSIHNGTVLMITQDINGNPCLMSDLEPNNIRILSKSFNNYTTNQEKIKVLMTHLISLGGNINEQNIDGMTPFFIACDGKLTYLVRELYGQYQDRIDFTLEDNQGNCHIHYITSVPNSLEIMQALIAKDVTSINKQNIYGATPILQSAANNNVETLRLLLNCGADINILNSNGWHSWHFASMHGALDVMKLLKSLFPHIINSKTNDNISSLHLAAQEGHLETVKWLVTEGADINVTATQPYQQVTPFFLACSNKRTEVAEYLLSCQSFNNSMTDSLGKGSLHWILEFRSTDLIEKVLDKGGVNINNVDSKGITTLCWSVTYNLPHIIKFLVDKGADINIATRLGFLPIHEAAIGGGLEAVKMLKDLGANIDQSLVGHTVTSLWLAAQNGHLEVVRWLVDEHADINSKNSYNGMTALHIAIHQKRDAVAHFLVDRGADLTALSSDGHNAYTYACLATKCEQQALNISMRDLAIKVLNILPSEALQSIAGNRTVLSWTTNLDSATALQTLKSKLGSLQVDEYSPDGITAIYWAISNCHSNSLNWLKSNGADINKQNEQGFSCLHIIAPKISQNEQLKFALDNGANPNLQLINGMTPFFFSCSTAQNNMLTVETEEQKIEIRAKVKPNLLTLLAANPDISITDPDNQGYLSYGIEIRDLDILQNILDKGADINICDVRGMSTLYWATKYKWAEVVSWFLNHDANVNLATVDGSTPLHEALSDATSYSPDVIKILTKFGANCNAINSAGKTPINLARDNFPQSPEIVEWLEHPEYLAFTSILGAESSIVNNI